MSLLESIPSDWGYVLGALVFHEIVNLWQIGLVVKARKEHGVKAPELYKVGDKYEFYNRVQRAHQNTITEYYALNVVTMIGGAITHPKLAALGFMIWSGSRVPYTLGYRKAASSRRIGAIGYIGSFINKGLLAYSAYLLLTK